MRGRAVDLQRHLVADLDLAVALVLGGDRLAIAEAGVDQGAFAEALDQLGLSLPRAAAPPPRSPFPSAAPGPPRPPAGRKPMRSSPAGSARRGTRVSTSVPSPSFSAA